jgi:WD40 repeat protein/basic membrane lipoprotein Med (substrate-binding protein (PBP1-ABC) superfamily)/DNA-binding SARP family transcriptional activator
MLEIRVLGQFSLSHDGQVISIASRPAQSLFAYLALHKGICHRREMLAGMLWPDASESNSRAYLRSALWRIRKSFEEAGVAWDDFLEISDIDLAFRADSPAHVDADLILQRREPRQWRTEELSEITRQYAGDLLPGFYDEWILLERERLHAAFQSKMRLLLDGLLFQGQWTDAVTRAEGWIALGYAPESAYRALMIAYAALGDLTAMHLAFRRCRQNLGRDFGLEPSDDLAKLAADLEREGLPDLSTPIAEPAPPEVEDLPPEPGEPPYKGLTHFDVQDATIFFGREALIDRLVKRLKRPPWLTAVVGASGSGKSSLVRAGLVSAMSQDLPGTGERASNQSPTQYLARVVTPSEHPLEALTQAIQPAEGSQPTPRSLARAMLNGREALQEAVTALLASTGSSRLLLIVDQFEQLFTRCRSDNECAAFVDNLMSASESRMNGKVTVVITLRSDFYSHCAAYPRLRAVLSESQEFIGPMKAENLRRAIEQPALQAGWRFQPGLVDLIIREVRGEPGGLPLLSHALLECWKRRSGRTMTLKGYAQAGGVKGAIAKTAERVYQDFTPDEQAIARRIFLRLTDLGASGFETRRRAPTSELIVDPAESGPAQRVLQTLASARLVTLGRDWVEVSHEAVIREWPTLQAWLEGGREALRIHRHLTEASQEWEARGQDEADLYRGARLARVQEWAADHAEDLNPLEQSFLRASAELAERRERQREAQRQRELEVARKLAESEQARAEQEAETSQRLRSYAYALTALLALALIAAAYAVQQRNLATVEAHMAKARELTSASRNNLELDPELSILLALQALEESAAAGETAPRRAQEALHLAVLASRTEAILRGHTDRIFDATFSPDGKLVATASADGTLRIWDSSSGQERLLLDTGSRRPMKAVDFHPNGRYLASGGNDRVVRIWDLVSGEPVRELEGHSHWVQGVAFNPDGELLASASKDGTIQIWDWQAGLSRAALSQEGWPLASVAFSPDGGRIFASDLSGQLLVWDLSHPSTASVIAVEDIPPDMQGMSGAIGASALSPDGRRVASIDSQGVAHIWSVDGGEPLRSIQAGAGAANDFAFSPDGSWLASTGPGREAHIWDTANGEHLLALAGHTDRIYTLAFSPDGRRLVTAGEDQTARIWNISLPTEVASTPTDAAVTDLAFSADGQTIVAGLQGRAAPSVWDLENDVLVSATGADPEDSWATRIAVAPNGHIAAIAGIDRRVHLWDMSIGVALSDLPPHDGRVEAVAFSPDGLTLAAGGSDGAVKLWDLSGRGAQGPDLLAGDSVAVLAYSAVGDRLAAGNHRGDITLWDLESGRVQFLTAHTGRVNQVAFSPEGSRLASASDDGTARIWDLSAPDQAIDLVGHDAPVEDIAFNPDGSQLATVGVDGSLRLWDSKSGKELLSLSPMGWDAPSGLAFSPTDDVLAVSDSKGIYLLADDIDELAQMARDRLGRDFTADECRVYLTDEDCGAYGSAEVAEYLPPPDGHRICEFTEVAGVYDGGYGQEIYAGVLLASDELGWGHFVYESEFIDDPPRAMQRLQRSNCDLIVSPGTMFAGMTKNAAQANPDIAFQLIDFPVEEPPGNLWIQLYAPDEAAFLAGYLAAAVSQTGVVATYGGVAIPAVQEFMIGFEYGVRHYNAAHGADVTLLGWGTESGSGDFVGDFCCPPEGMQFTRQFIELGADVIMPVGGPYITYGSLIEASKQEGIYVVGVDVDQALATPEFASVVLTSVEKRARMSVLRAAQAIEDGTFAGGTYIGTLETGEVALSPFHELDDLVSEAMKAEIDQLRADIIAGKIQTRP